MGLSPLQELCSPCVDVSMQREDHRLVAVELSCNMIPRKDVTRHAVNRILDDNLDLRRLWTQPVGQFVNPEMDIHSHAAWVQQAVVDAICPHERRSKPRGPIKKTISNTTWALVCEKRETRNQLAIAQRHQFSCYRFLIFHAWKLARTAAEDPALSADLITQMSIMIDQHDQPIAIALRRFRDLGRQVTDAVRFDDIQFFQGLLQAPAECLDPGQVRRFWALLRKALPQFRQRRTGFQPRQRADLDDALTQYFQVLETGIPATPAELVQQCHERQQQVLVKQRHFTLDEVPSLFDLEDELRDTQPYKSTGYDVLPSNLFKQAAVPLAEAHFGLMMKSWLWQQEAVGHKGGLLTIIPKCPNALAPKQFRGIMLLPSFAKRLHAVVRKRLIAHLLPQKLEGQLLEECPSNKLHMGAMPYAPCAKSWTPMASQQEWHSWTSPQRSTSWFENL